MFMNGKDGYFIRCTFMNAINVDYSPDFFISASETRERNHRTQPNGSDAWTANHQETIWRCFVFVSRQRFHATQISRLTPTERTDEVNRQFFVANFEEPIDEQTETEDQSSSNTGEWAQHTSIKTKRGELREPTSLPATRYLLGH